MPRSLFIPTIGDTLVLAEDWSFPLHQEVRNLKFSRDNFPMNFQKWGESLSSSSRVRLALLPSGTHLKVSRIYIRNGGENLKQFDSVSFHCNLHLKGKAAKGAIKGRFWAKLADVNRIIFEEVSQESLVP